MTVYAVILVICMIEHLSYDIYDVYIYIEPWFTERTGHAGDAGNDELSHGDGIFRNFEQVVGGLPSGND